MAFLTTNQIITLLYKKYLDSPNTNILTTSTAQEPFINSSKNIYSQQNFAQLIPLSNPNDFYTVETFESTTKQISSNYPYIAYYSTLSLSSATPFNRTSYTNLQFNKLILNTYHYSYTPTIWNNNKTINISESEDGKYINIDPDSGILSFYNIVTSNIVSWSNPPVVSFYRYEGLIGNDTSMIKIQEFSSLSGTSNIDPSTAIALIDSSFGPRRIYLPPTNIIYGKYIIIKDIGGAANSNIITLQSVSSDIFENNSNISYINTKFGSISLIAQKGKWSPITSDGGSVTNIGISSLSSIISYGLSSIVGIDRPGTSSLSSIVSYGLSTVAAQPHYGVSSLSSIVSYGLSSIVGIDRPGTSSLSSIVSYGLSTVYSPYGVSSLSSIVSYGLSTVYSPYGVSSLSSIISYGLSSIIGIDRQGTSSLSSIVSYGLSTVYSPYGISSLSSIISYGLSSIVGIDRPGTSSLSSIVSYGLSTVYSPYGVSSLSSIVSYGLSTVYSPYGVSSLSSIISYGLSTVAAKPDYGVSSLSSIVSYGLSTVSNNLLLSNTNTNSNVLSLSSIISYGLSSVNIIVNNITCNAAAAYYSGGEFIFNAPVSFSNPSFTSNTINYNNYYNEPVSNSNITYCNTTITNNTTTYSNNNSTGVSSLSSIVSYGLSTVYSPYGISSLSSIISYGLSSIVGIDRPGTSSLSSIVSYGLSTVAAHPHIGVSSLSSIVSYGLSTVYSPYGISSLSSIISYGLSSIVGIDRPGTSSLSSIVSYGLSTIAAQPHIGVSSLSSIVSYGLSTVYSPYGVSSLSSIISYGLSTVAAQPHHGVSSLSSIISYGLSSLVNGIVTMTGQLIINSNSSNPALTVNGPLNLIDTLYGTSNTLYVNSNLLYFNNNILYGSRQLQPQFITFT
jgi:hypothetical protein